MRFGLTLIAVLGLGWQSGCGTHEGTGGTREAHSSLRALDTEEAEFLRLLNAYRAQNGLAALTATPLLNQVAYNHSADMAARRYFEHTNLEGLSPFARMEAAGYRGGYMAENIAAGNATGSATFTQWRNSPGHDANMRGARYRAIGIGRAYDAASPYRWYWTTNFGDVVDASAQAAVDAGVADAGLRDAGLAVRDGGVAMDAGVAPRDGGAITVDAGTADTCLGGRTEVEPNERSTSANALVGAACGRLGSSIDQDWFSITARVGSPYALSLRATGDARMEVWRLSGSSWLYVRSGTAVSSTAASSSRYLIRVRSSTGARQNYTLTRTR